MTIKQIDKKIIKLMEKEGLNFLNKELVLNLSIFFVEGYQAHIRECLKKHKEKL